MLLDPPQGPLSSVLQPLPGGAARTNARRFAQGKLSIELRKAMPKETRIDLQAERLVRDLCLWLRVVHAKDLRLPPALHSAMTHASVNAFCIIKWNNHEVGRTSVVAGTSAPQFSAANFIIPITAEQRIGTGMPIQRIITSLPS